MRLRDLPKTQTTISETDRILALPSIYTYPEAEAYGESLRLPGGDMVLKPIQADALWVMHQYGGLVAPIGVGGGKTLIVYLAGRALGVKRVVVMLRRADVRGYEVETAKYAHHFDPGDVQVTVVPYNMLSDPRASKLLEELAPEAIVCDEAHNLANPDSARTIRFTRYLDAHRDTKFVAMSGTLFKTSITEVAHLAKYALGPSSPLPHGGVHLDSWSHVLDPRGMATETEHTWFERVISWAGVSEAATKIERARKAAHIRFASAPGVVYTDTQSTGVELTINKIKLSMPPRLAEQIDEVKASRIAPSGEDVITDDMHLVDTLRCMATGFYNRWNWEAIGGRDEEWLARRSAWNRALNIERMSNSAVDYDSPKLIGDAVLEKLTHNPKLADKYMLYFTRKLWNEVEDRPVPPVEAVWLNTYLIDWVVNRYKNQPVILWYSSRGVGEELARRGIPVYGEGTWLEGPARLVAASIQVHGTSRNLQDWNHAVVLEPPSGGTAWEQMLGRLHRNGQLRPVTFDVLLPHKTVEQALTNAIENAKFIQTMQGTPQRLLSATFTSAA